MATLYVRNVPDPVYRQIRQIAAAQGQSLNAYVLETLEQAVSDEAARRAGLKALAAIRRRRQPLPEGAPDSVSMIRQIRARHG